MYFFEEDFDEDTVRRNYAFYEPFTVHESSLSPCVHSIIAAKLKEDEAAYAFYLRTARLDLDDYSAEVEEGLHITSMAGTWMSIVEGFAGMRVKNDSLSFSPRLPKAWDKLSFKINFRDHIYSITMGQNTFYCEVDSDAEKTLIIAEKEHLFSKEISIELQEINVY